MQTFQVTLTIDTRAVVPERFLQEARKEAQAEDATPFLKRVQELYPDDDDQFMLAVVKNAFRGHVRTSLLDFMLRSQVGGSVSPVQVTNEIIMQPKAHAEEAVAEGGTQQLRIGSGDSAVLASVPNSAERKACAGTNCGIVGGASYSAHSTECTAEYEEATKLSPAELAATSDV